MIDHLRRLSRLTAIPSVSGDESRVIGWVREWARRRSNLIMSADRHGNLLLGSIHGSERSPIVAVAHMDHPGFVVEAVDGRMVEASFRGGVRSEYFLSSPVEFFDRRGMSHRGRVKTGSAAGRYVVTLAREAPLQPGDVGRWWFPETRLGIRGDRLRAHACDDLAGVAAALGVLDATRKRPDQGHYMVLLTRAEEEGLIGATGAALTGTLPDDARILSIETSRAGGHARIGDGPIVRVGDASSVFDAGLTNAVTETVRRAEVPHQRKLMAGGTCEATAFTAFGHSATGVCLALDNYHNMGALDKVEAGTAPARPAPEEISISDFLGLIALLESCVEGLDDSSATIRERLVAGFEDQKHLLT